MILTVGYPQGPAEFESSCSISSLRRKVRSLKFILTLNSRYRNFGHRNATGKQSPFIGMSESWIFGSIGILY